MVPYKEFLEKEEGEFNKRVVRNHHKGKKPKVFCEDIFTFDIETSSGWINEHGNVIGYHKHRSSNYWNNLEPISLCYIWQFSHNADVYYGRELRDFIKVLEHLPKDRRIIIWVHNLSFEAHFLMSLLKEVSFFARTAHKPMKMTSSKFPNIEFRCTYFLTNSSLENWAKKIGMTKLIGDLDYRKIRTPKTKLTEKELSYCSRDCEIVYEGIKIYCRKYGSIFNIPLTQTGTVRKEVKDILLKDTYYSKWIKKLVPKSPKIYSMLQKVFAGGYTHANRTLAGKLLNCDMALDGKITHWDFTSHYPSQMFKKYPATPWAFVGRDLPEVSEFENAAYIFHLTFHKIRCTKCNTYIQASKSRIEGKRVYDNGRVISADSLEIWITEQDYLTISESYKWDSLEVHSVYKSRKKYLPKKYIEFILDKFEEKCKWDGVEGMEDIYQRSKEILNSLYGMMVSALCYSDIEFNHNDYTWIMTELTEDMVAKKLEDLQRWWDKNYFLSYSWGCWVTAYARRELWRCVLHGDNDINTIYMDTDSMFILGAPSFDWYNKEVTEKLENACRENGIDPERIRGTTPKGKTKQLGLFLQEANCKEFITLHSKCYCEKRLDDKLYLTVAGINKGAVNCLHNDLRNFKDGLVFDKDHNGVHKLFTTYCTDQPEVTWPDGYKSTYKTGINLRPTGYEIRMTEDYKTLINYTPEEMAAEVLEMAQNPRFQNHLRGKWSTKQNGV